MSLFYIFAFTFYQYMFNNNTKKDNAKVTNSSFILFDVEFSSLHFNYFINIKIVLRRVTKH